MAGITAKATMANKIWGTLVTMAIPCHFAVRHPAPPKDIREHHRLGNIVHGEGKGHKDPQAQIEHHCNADGHSLGCGMERIQKNKFNGVIRTWILSRARIQLLGPGIRMGPIRINHPHNPAEHHRESGGAQRGGHQDVTGPEHQSRRQGIGPPDPGQRHLTRTTKRRSPQTREARGQSREKQDDQNGLIAQCRLHDFESSIPLRGNSKRHTERAMNGSSSMKSYMEPES